MPHWKWQLWQLARKMKFTIHDVFMNDKTKPEENLELKQNSTDT